MKFSELHFPPLVIMFLDLILSDQMLLDLGMKDQHPLNKVLLVYLQ